MPDPVKLSRERWEMLAGSSPMAGTIVDAKYPLRSMTLQLPREIDGVIFLPAEYVPMTAIEETIQFGGKILVDHIDA